MDLDTIDDESVSFDMLLRNAREEVLHMAAPSLTLLSAPIDWSKVAERYDAFKDVSQEARKRGELLGPVLVAADGLTRVVEEQATTSAPVCSRAEAEVLSALAQLYLELFVSSPVPTKGAWKARAGANFLHEPLATSLALLHAEGGESSTSRMPYTAQLVETVESAKRGRGGAEGEEEEDGAAAACGSDDGAFVEEAFKAFLRRCQLLGRKCSRVPCASSSSAGSARVKEMIATISGYLSSGTLEW